METVHGSETIDAGVDVCVRVCVCMCMCAFGYVCVHTCGRVHVYVHLMCIWCWWPVMFNTLPITFKTVTITRHDILKRRKKAKNLTTMVGQESKYADIILMNYITK